MDKPVVVDDGLPFQFLIGRLVTNLGGLGYSDNVTFQFLIGRLVTLRNNGFIMPRKVSIPHR